MALSRFVLMSTVTITWPATWSEVVNQAANPPVSTPAVPASTTAQYNNNAQAVAVTVTGGTVSAISVGGVATGLTTGTFYVPAGSSITLTYSVAPTWSWGPVVPLGGGAGESVQVANPAPPGGQLGNPPTMIFPVGTTIFADSSAIPAGTPGSGAQQLYAAIGSSNLRAYVQGQDDVGHAALSN